MFSGCPDWTATFVKPASARTTFDWELIVS